MIQSSGWGLENESITARQCRVKKAVDKQIIVYLTLLMTRNPR